MPSHIFTRLGMWDDDIASNTRSAAAARRFEVEQQMHALWDQRGHAWDYMVYAYLQQGRDRDAKRIVEEAAAVTAGYPVGSLPNAYALAAIPARYPLERGPWREAAAPPVRPAPEGGLLGALLLELARPAEAAGAYAASLTRQPNRARSLFGAARAAELAGDRTTARARYRQYLTLMQRSDGERSEVGIARLALTRR